MLGVHRCFTVRMAIQASEGAVVCSIGMAVGTCIPFTFVFSAVDGEILTVVIKRSTLPGCDAVTSLTFFRKT